GSVAATTTGGASWAHPRAPGAPPGRGPSLGRRVLYDEFLRPLARRGLPVPEERLNRDFSEPYEAHPGVMAVFRTVYSDPEKWWDGYEMAEKLVDVEERFQLWRFRHMMTVHRIIGFKPGTGGSSGVPFLRRSLDVRCFPEPFDLPTDPDPPPSPPTRPPPP